MPSLRMSSGTKRQPSLDQTFRLPDEEDLTTTAEMPSHAYGEDVIWPIFASQLSP